MSLITSILTGGTHSHQTTSELANALATDLLSAGVVDSVANTGGIAPCTGGFAPNAQGSPNMTIAISTGVEYVVATPTGQGSQILRVKNGASANVTIAANATGSTRYDWIYVKIDPDVAVNTDAGGDDAASLVACRSTSNTADNSGSAPAFGNLIAVVTVANGASSISNANIADKRTEFGIRAQSNQTDGWNLLPSLLAFNANNGQRETVLTAALDLTATMGVGTKLKVPRATTPPTQCTALNGTNQYWNKTSGITGITFTDDFVISAWVKLTSYTTAMIASRYNGTSGWDFYIDSSGHVNMQGFNASASNFSQVVSYQSVPLNRWVHITGQLDMSTFTATPTTSYIMIDGLDIPASVSRGGTNPTALIQAGNLEIGSDNGGTNLFPGEIAELAIFSAKVTQATIRTYMGQSMVGSETSLAAYYKFNGNGNDSTSNANNLTGNGSAVATTADSPFNSTEYGIVTSISYSAPTTTMTVFSPTNSIIPNQTLSPASYSRERAPLGFPAAENRWEVVIYYKGATSQSSPTAGTWYNLTGGAITVPAGNWRASYAMDAYSVRGSSTLNDVLTTLSTANSTESDAKWSAIIRTNPDTESHGTLSRSGYLSPTVATTYYLNHKTVQTSSTQIGSDGTTVAGEIRVVCGYL